MAAKWITVTEPSSKTSYYIFKKTFTLTEAPVSFHIRVSADTRYKLYINGNEITQGPCQSGEYLKYFEELDAVSALRVGENIIEAKVLHVADPWHFITMFRKEKPAFYLDGIVLTENGSVDVSTDESYESAHITGITLDNRDGLMPSLAPFEEVSGDTHTVSLKTVVFYTPRLDNHCYSPFGALEPYRMEKRPVPLVAKGEEKELAFVRDYIGEDGKYNAIFASDIYTTAMLTYDFCAEKDSKLRFIYAECALTADENGKLYKGLRDHVDGVIDSTAFDILTATGKEQTYELFYYRAFRYIRVECDKKPAYIKLRAARYVYDYEKNAQNSGIGSFASSQPLHTNVWQISKNTLECCTHETVVDCPFYEQQQYIMDGVLESLYGYRFSNDTSIQKKLLLDLSQSQNIDGLLDANYPNVTTQTIPGFSLYFVFGVREYLRYTGDTSFAKKMISVCHRMLDYFESTVTKDGLVSPEYGWNFLDWVHGWLRGVPTGGYDAPMTAYNLIYAAALNSAAEVCDACDFSGLANDFRIRSEKIIRAVNTHCYDNERGLYTDVVGLRNYSQHTTIWAILSGAVTGDAARELIVRTLESEDVAKCSFSMGYYLLRALEKLGCYEQYADRVLTGWKIMLDNHCTSWCEDPVTCRSECHAWACVPIYEMSAMILGVQPLENGFSTVRIKPYTLGLTQAKGRVPMPNGWIDVEWQIENGQFSLSVASSCKLQFEIILPNGKQTSTFADQITISDHL